MPQGVLRKFGDEDRQFADLNSRELHGRCQVGHAPAANRDIGGILYGNRLVMGRHGKYFNNCTVVPWPTVESNSRRSTKRTAPGRPQPRLSAVL